MKLFLSLLLLLLVSSCARKYQLFRERGDNGDYFFAEIEPHKKNKKAKSKWILGGRSNQSQHVHDEYHINYLSCDTIVKKIFYKRNVTILILTNDPKVDYPITKEDKFFYYRLKDFIDSTNNCYSGFIDKATGYKLYYNGKQR